MAQELVPPPAKQANAHVHCAELGGEGCSPLEHVHCDDFDGDDPCPPPEHEHCHAAGDCDSIACQLDCDGTSDDLTAAVEIIVRFTRATRGWSGDLIADAQAFLRELAPSEMWP